MKYLAYSGVALVAFWSGAVWKEANTPPPIIYVTKQDPVTCAALTRHCSKEVQRKWKPT